MVNKSPNILRFSFSGTIMLACILMLSVLDLSAQFETRKGKFNIGVEGGVQFTDISTSGSIYQSTSGLGYALSAFGDYYISNDFRLRMALGYDNRAYQMNASLPLADTAGNIGNSYYLYQVDYSMNYLTIPVGIVYTRGGEKFKIHLQFNFYYSILLGATMEGAEDFYVAPEDVGSIPDDSDLLPGHNVYAYSGPATGVAYSFNTRNDEFSSFDFGINFLLGGHYQVTPSVGIHLSLGFTYGLADVFINPQLDSRWSQITKVNLGFAYTLW
jgi:hypothetical protein